LEHRIENFVALKENIKSNILELLNKLFFLVCLAGVAG